MKKTLSTGLILLFASGAPSFGAAGIFDELVWTSTNAVFSFVDPGTTFFEIDDDNTNLFGAAEFAGADLGVFNVGDTLFLTGEQKSFKNNGTDVTSHTLFWSIDGANFNSFGYNFEADIGPNPGDQRWGAANGGFLSANVLDGLAPGNYELTLFSRITTNGVDNTPTEIFNNAGGANYVATFEVVPEPSSALLMGLAGFGLLLRRRA